MDLGTSPGAGVSMWRNAWKYLCEVVDEAIIEGFAPGYDHLKFDFKVISWEGVRQRKPSLELPLTLKPIEWKAC